MLTKTIFCVAVTGAVAVLGCATENETPEPEDVVQDESPLKTTEHQHTTQYLCVAAGLSESFCARLAAEAFNVDRLEWSRLEAHAMPANGQKLCDAAAATQNRLRRRGDEIHAILGKHTIEPSEQDALASSLGRALHTIQDNCAHEGMTNPQHSWYSNRGWCLSNGEDPDEDPAKIQCARDETWKVLLAFVKAIKDAHFRVETLGVTASLGTWNPDRDQVCSFLREWQGFDGVDHRWNNGVTVPAFRDTLIKKIASGEDVADVCQGLAPTPSGRSPIAHPRPRSAVGVSDPLCITTKVYCLGE